MARVSIVIPTFNRAADLRWALRSVFAQTWSDWECLVVDNESTDDTDAVVGEFSDPRLRLIKIQNNGAVAASRNLGVQHSTTEYVAFLDSDDWWAPRKLELSMRYLLAGAAFVYHDLYMVGVDRRRRFWRRSPSRPLRAPVFEDLLAGGNAINLSSAVLHRALLQQVGGFSVEPTLIAAEDFDAWLRIARLTEDFVRMPGALGYYKVGVENLSSPARTISSLESLEQRYAADIARLGNPQWIRYTKARAYYLQGKHDLARSQLAGIDWRGAPLAIRARGLLMQVQLKLSRAA
jgi:glycosyltransferase involved in cell wall biosynthesis